MIYNKKNFPELPQTWEKASVDLCFTQISTNAKKVKQKDYIENGEFPVIDQGQGLIGGYHDNSEFLIKPDKPVTIFGDHTRILKYIDFDFRIISRLVGESLV
jgi:type I restriction enzyme S subunit